MDSHQLAAQRFLNLIPPALPLDVLEQYGIRASISQAEILSEHILLLTLFWIKDALNAGVTSEYGKMIWEEVIEGLKQVWQEKFGFEHLTPIQIMEKVSPTVEGWKKSLGQTYDPITLFSYATTELETTGILSSQQTGMVVALFLDFVPVEEIGEVASAIEQGMA